MMREIVKYGFPDPIGIYDFETGQVHLASGQTLGHIDVGRLQRLQMRKPEPLYADDPQLVPYDQLEKHTTSP